MGIMSTNSNGLSLFEPLLRDKKKAKTKTEKKGKYLNLHLDEKAEATLKHLASRIYPSTQSEVLRTSLQVLEQLVREHDAGSVLYIQREGDDEPTPIEILG